MLRRYFPPRLTIEEQKRRLVEAAIKQAMQRPQAPILRFPVKPERFEEMAAILDPDADRGYRTRLFLTYLGEMADEMFIARRAAKEIMRTEQSWDFPRIMRRDLKSLAVLSGLLVAALQYRAGFAVDDARILALVREGLEPA